MVAEEAKKMAQGATGEEQKSTDIQVEPNNTGNQGSSEADMERIAEAGRAARLPNYGGEETKAAQTESSADKTFQENMGRQKYAHTNDLIERLEKEQEDLADNRTPEQKKKAERREKMAKIFAALGDGVAAMSNLVLASKGAVPYQSKSSLSKAVGDRYDKFRKDLEERKAKSLALSERIAQLRQGVEDRKAEDERWKAAQALAQARLNAELYDKKWDREFKTGEANRDQQNKDREYNRNLIKDDADQKIKQQQANAATTNARANATRAAIYVRNGGGGTKYEFQDKTYGNKDAWGAAIKREAKRLGIDLSEEYKTTDPLGRARTSERLKPIDQLLAEVNDVLAAQGGGSGSGNKGGKGKGY